MSILTRWEPFRELRQEMRQMRRFRRAMDQLFGRREIDAGDGWLWGLEVEDQDDSVVIRAEAPGFDGSNFDLRLEDSRLVLCVSKKVETKDEKGNVQEYQEQKCYESIALPAGIDKDKVDAKYHNGVLTVTLHKTAASKAKRIAVKAD